MYVSPGVAGPVRCVRCVRVAGAARSTVVYKQWYGDSPRSGAEGRQLQSFVLTELFEFVATILEPDFNLLKLLTITPLLVPLISPQELDPLEKTCWELLPTERWLSAKTAPI